MALGDNTLRSAAGNSQRGRNPFMVQTTLNWATALSDKGSALAAADVVPVIAVPKGTMVLNAGIEVVTATDGSTFTVDLGTGVDPNVFAATLDATSAAGVLSQNPAAYQPVMAVADDNIDVVIAALSGGAVTSGEFRVWAVLMDCTDMGDTAADEVARDALA